MSLEITMLSGKIQTQKATECVTLFLEMFAIVETESRFTIAYALPFCSFLRDSL